MKKCKFCTAEIEDNEIKCSYCGEKQDKDEVTTESIIETVKDSNQESLDEIKDQIKSEESVTESIKEESHDEPIIEQDNTNKVELNVNKKHLDSNTKKNNILFIILIISISLSMISCFLPYVKIGDFSMNYVYNKSIASISKSSGIKDGIFIIIFGIVSIVTLVLGKKKIPTVVCQFLSIGVFLMDYFDAKNNPITNLVTRYYGIGFYLVLIFLLISVTLAIIRLIFKDKFD